MNIASFSRAVTNMVQSTPEYAASKAEGGDKKESADAPKGMFDFILKKLDLPKTNFSS